MPSFAGFLPISKIGSFSPTGTTTMTPFRRRMSTSLMPLRNLRGMTTPFSVTLTFIGLCLWPSSIRLRALQSNYRCHDLTNASLQVAIVGDGRAHRDFGGARGRDAVRDQLRRIDQQARRDSFFQSMPAQVADFLSDQNQIARS